MIKRAAVIGLGLIGGSFALALRERYGCDHITGYDQAPESAGKALELGVIDAVANSVGDAVAEADLVLLAVPVLGFEPIFTQIRQRLWSGDSCRNPNLVLTDAGSVKGAVVEAARTVFGHVPACFVPAHPIAGSEKHGITAARSDLFVDHKLIITPHEGISEAAVQLVTACWQAAGAQVIRMEIGHHDEVLAGTSHLPHFLAYALVDTLSSQGDSLEIFQYAAGGFRDFTRIAASDPAMWRDVFSSNGPALLKILDRYMADLDRLRSAVAEGDSDTLMETFRRAKAARDYFTSLHDGQ